MGSKSLIGALAAAEAGTLFAANVPEGGKSGAQTNPLVEAVREAAFALQRKDWEQGTLAQAFVELEDWDRVIRMAKSALVLREADGRLAVVGSGSPTDPSMGGEAYSLAARRTGDPQLSAAVDGLLAWILKGAPRSSDGTLYHLTNRPEVWSDGFNCAPPFLAVMGHEEEALKQIAGYKQRLWDKGRNLLAHQAVEAPDGSVHFRQPVVYWGGGMGWAATGLVRLLRVLRVERSADRAELIAFLQQVVDGALKYMRTDGLFHDEIDRPESFVETNLSQMLAFSIFTAVDAGWMGAAYLKPAHLMRKAARSKVDAFGFVQGACGAPHFERPGVSAEAQAFFLMMEAAYAKHERGAGAR